MLRTKASLLKDYREHYRADAELIEDPAALAPVRFASESRRLESVVRMVGADAGPALLDIGCGSGWLARQCSQHGARVTASDLAPRGVAGARSRFPDAASFIVADAYHMPMRSESFDAIILSEVLEHLEEVDSACRRCGACSSPVAGRSLRYPSARPSSTTSVFTAITIRPPMPTFTVSTRAC